MATKYTADKNGVFSTLVWDGTYTEDGSKHRKQIRSKKSSKDLENLVKQYQRDVEERKAVNSTSISFCDYADQWLALYKANREINTIYAYKNVMNAHFPKIKDVKLKDIRRMHLQMLLNDCTPTIGKKLYVTFKQIVKSAIIDRYLPAIAIEDIFAGVECPRPIQKERRTLTATEKKAVEHGNFEPMDKAFLYIIYSCGLRREEALALSVFDLDFKKSEISITKALVFDVNNPVIKGTKSAHGVRKVPMPKMLQEYLAEYVKTLPGTNLFFMKNNPHMTRSGYGVMWNRTRNEIIRYIKGEGQIPENLTAHIFRHNYCSMLCYQIPTVSIKRISALMGDTQKVVLDTYDHIILDKEDAQKAVENAIGF
ncbi:site-specific integrase [Lachnospiraceae bacterium ZAX-1]